MQLEHPIHEKKHEAYQHRYKQLQRGNSRVAGIKLANTMKRECNYFSAMKRVTAVTGMLCITKGVREG
jgi:hypothetical protein